MELRTFYGALPEPLPGADCDPAAVCKAAEAEALRIKDEFNEVRVEAKDHGRAWSLFRKLLSHLSIATSFTKTYTKGGKKKPVKSTKSSATKRSRRK